MFDAGIRKEVGVYGYIYRFVCICNDVVCRYNFSCNYFLA